MSLCIRLIMTEEDIIWLKVSLLVLEEYLLSTVKCLCRKSLHVSLSASILMPWTCSALNPPEMIISIKDAVFIDKNIVH